MILGAIFGHWRSVRGLTQEQLAYEAGVTTGTYSRIESGVSDPRWSTVRSIADVLDITVTIGAQDAS
jgi:transcriptional regulator with XRE-family HTH domain